MGRVIRRVPPNWKHPKNLRGEFIPLHNTHYEEAAKEWVEGFIELEKKKAAGEPTICDCNYYWEYASPPEEHLCVPYKKEEATWYQVYETVSEGTPTTPPFETEEELICHLTKFGEQFDSDYGNTPITDEKARKFVMEDKWAPSFTFSAGRIASGIESC